MRLKILNILVISVIALAFRLNVAFAHGGVDDEPPQPVKAVTTDSVTNRLITSDKTEVLLKYAKLKLKETATIQVFVTDFKTNKPLTGLDVDLSFKGLGKAIEVNAKSTTTEGLYQTNLNFDTPGSYNLTLDVAGNKVKEQLSATGFEVKTPSLAGPTGNNNSWLTPLLEILLAVFLILAIYLFVTGSKKQQVRNAI